MPLGGAAWLTYHWGALIPAGLPSTARLGTGKCWVQVSFFFWVGVVKCPPSMSCFQPWCPSSVHLPFSTFQSSLVVSCIIFRVNSCTLQGETSLPPILSRPPVLTHYFICFSISQGSAAINGNFFHFTPITGGML